MNRIDMSSSVVALLACLALAGCASLSTHEYRRPDLIQPAQWQHAATPPAEAKLSKEIAGQGNAAWWRAFADDQLNELIEQVLRNNNNLAAAGVSVRKAWLQAGLAADKQMPVVSAEIDASHGVQRVDGVTTKSNARSSSLGVSYELDLWGRLSSARDAASWEAQATEEDLANTAWALVATTARLYWQIAYLNQRLRLSDENIAYARQTLAIAEAKLAAGAATRIDVGEAEQSLATQESNRSDLLQQRVEQRNALGILFNAPPGGVQFKERAALPDAELPPVAAGLPAELLARRPDLRAAEKRLRETLASGDATSASYYPRLTLTGSLGSSSPALGNLLRDPASTLGAGLVLPFLQWNEMQLTRKSAEADYAKAIIDFRQTLYSAMADVENALSARTQYLDQARQLARARAAAQQSEALYAVRYEAGAVPLQTLLDAQQNRREAETALLLNRYNRYVNHATLCQALGGDLSP